MLRFTLTLANLNPKDCINSVILSNYKHKQMWSKKVSSFVFGKQVCSGCTENIQELRNGQPGVCFYSNFFVHYLIMEVLL